MTQESCCRAASARRILLHGGETRHHILVAVEMSDHEVMDSEVDACLRAHRLRGCLVNFTTDKVISMNWDILKGNWKQFKGKVKENWGDLTDDELDMIAGQRDQLTGKIQERYGIAKDEAERQVSDWEARNQDWVPDRDGPSRH
jgi:uncharacterized protein YjbJ (UPF0337 family)